MDSRNKELTIWNPLTKGYFEDPYPHLSDCQVLNDFQIGVSVSNYIVLFRHKHVKEALRHSEINTSKLSSFFQTKEPIIFKNNSSCPFMVKTTSKWLTYLDGDEHLNARKYLEKGLDNFNYEKIVELAVEEMIHDLQTIKNTDIDLVDIAIQLPILVLNKMLGIPADITFEKIKQVSFSLAYSQDLFVSRQNYLDINKDMEWLFLLLSDLYDTNMNSPNNSLISHLIQLKDQEKLHFTKDEIISMLTMVYFASIETSKDAISMIFYELLKNKNLISILKENNKIKTNLLIEEFLRFTSPLQYTVRETTEEYKIEDTTIPANSKLLLCLASANRDETVFNEPNKIIPDRNFNPHLSFGMGRHSCTGAKLARIELRQLLPKIAPLLEGFDFHPNHPPIWQRTILMRGIKNFPVLKRQS